MSATNGIGACLFVVDKPTERLKFLFNPTEYSVSKSASWNRPTAKGAKKASTPEFAGTHPASIQMEVLFDRWATAHDAGPEKVAGKVATPGDVDVSKDVKQLFDWLNATKGSHSDGTPEPPVLAFDWGGNKALSWFKGYLKSVNAKYTMVWADGTPTRATASITLEEVPAEAQEQNQNPTSGGVGGHRTHVMTAGDSLQSVAYGEFGDAHRWREIAEHNAIDDPLRIPAGTTLIIASKHDVVPVPVTEL
jgi:hypothetical protein